MKKGKKRMREINIKERERKLEKEISYPHEALAAGSGDGGVQVARVLPRANLNKAI